MDVPSLIAQWRQFAVANRTHAAHDRREGDEFGAALATARGEVRQAAAELLSRLEDDPMAAAKHMHQQARELWQHHWPFVGFDEAALKYTQARTWQDCARAIDPSLPVVQPRLTAE
jgi:hypothetical protein